MKSWLSSKRMQSKQFFDEVDRRLAENRQLEEGGLPRWLRGSGSVVGEHTFLSLVLGSLLVTIGGFWGFGARLFSPVPMRSSLPVNRFEAEVPVFRVADGS